MRWRLKRSLKALKAEKELLLLRREVMELELELHPPKLVMPHPPPETSPEELAMMLRPGSPMVLLPEEPMEQRELTEEDRLLGLTPLTTSSPSSVS